MSGRLIRTLGGLFGGLVPAATGAVAWWLGWDLSSLALIGVIPGVIAGSALAPWAVASRSSFPPTLAAAATGVLLGIGLVSISEAVGGSALQLLFLLPYVLGYGLALGFPVAIPAAFAAVQLLRGTVRKPPRAVLAVVLLGAATTVLGIPAVAYGEQIAARRELPELQSASPLGVLDPVLLGWEVANCSPWTYTIRVTETLLDGTRSTHVLAAPGGSAVGGTLELEPGWESTIEADASAALPPAWRGPYPAIRDALGGDIVARFEIASNGERTTLLAPPSGQDLPGPRLCALRAMPDR